MWAASVTVVSDDFPLPTIAFVLLATVVNQYARFFPEVVPYFISTESLRVPIKMPSLAVPAFVFPISPNMRATTISPPS